MNTQEVRTAIRNILKHHGLTKVGDGVVEGDFQELIEKILRADRKKQISEQVVKAEQDRAAIQVAIDENNTVWATRS